MSDDVLRALLDARERRERCALVTVAATRGSVPREAGAKMLVFADRRLVGTIGGGKFEALVAEEALVALGGKTPVLKTYPLHECDVASFGAICGGEMTVLIEPQILGEALFLVGAGHCSRALARLAQDCGWHVTVIDDRAELLADFPAQQRLTTPTAPDFIASRAWQPDEALVLISRNHELDREALHAAVRAGGMGYLGMMGSGRKVRQVFDALIARGTSIEGLSQVFAPIGLDLGAEAPAEIAVSIMAEILAVLRGQNAAHLRAPVVAA
ncbi:MAG: XdhC family protein [Chthoniobacteraceae bacterium]